MTLEDFPQLGSFLRNVLVVVCTHGLEAPEDMWKIYGKWRLRARFLRRNLLNFVEMEVCSRNSYERVMAISDFFFGIT